MAIDHCLVEGDRLVKIAFGGFQARRPRERVDVARERLRRRGVLLPGFGETPDAEVEVAVLEACPGRVFGRAAAIRAECILPRQICARDVVLSSRFMGVGCASAVPAKKTSKSRGVSLVRCFAGEPRVSVLD